VYLDKINRQWSAYMKANDRNEKLQITNTTKLNLNRRQYMLEFVHNGLRYHLYHALNEPVYDMRRLQEGYENTSLEKAFGITQKEAAELLSLFNGFMRQHYDEIQTSVDCGEGMERAMEAIRKARL
jgi:hypothetical protein